MTTQRDRIVEMAARPGGVSSAMIQQALHTSAASIATTMACLEKQKRVVRGKRAGYKLHWFTTAEARDAWQNVVPKGQNHNTIKPQGLVDIGKPVPGSRARAPSSPLQHITLEGSRAVTAGIPPIPRALRAFKASAPREVIVPPDVKVTRGPSWTHDPRYSCAPGELVFGAGFSAVGAGRDINTGEAWK